MMKVFQRVRWKFPEVYHSSYYCPIKFPASQLQEFSGGCAGVIIGHPLDTVKIHLQTESSINSKYNGTLHCFKSLLAKEGARGLYRGLSSPLIGVAAINAIVFGVYGNTQRHLSNPDALRSHLVAGATAGFFQSFFCSPMELAKSRLQVSTGRVGLWDCLKQAYNQGGTRGIFRGLGMTITREIPAFGSYFLVYEWMTRTDDHTPISTTSMLVSGGVAGVVSWILVYPVDVLKSRMQIDGADGVPKYKDTYDCLKKNLRLEGYKFLYKGLTPTVIRAFPVNAATFATVTWTIRLFSGEVPDKREIPPSETLWGRYTDAAVYTLKVSEAAAA